MSDTKNHDRPGTSWDSSNPEDLHRIMFEEAVDGLFITDPQGRLVAVNPRGIGLTGYSREELLGLDLTDLIPPQDLARDPIRMNELQQGGIVTKERRIRRKDGSLLPVEISARMLPEGNLLGQVRDISERRKAQDSVRASENLLSSIFRAAPTGIGVVTNRILLAVNDRICEMIGFSREELIGQSARVLYPSDADFEYVGTEKYRQIRERGTGTVETRWQCKDGRIIDVLMSSSPINPSDLAAGVTFTALDITDRKKAEAERDQLQTQLLQAQKMESVARLAGGVAHDFNNMLTAILGHAQLALLRCTPAEPIHADLQAIEESAQRSADLTRQLLAFARKQTVAPKILDLNDTVAGMLKMLLRMIGEDIDLVWMPGAGLWPVRIDPSQIDQLLANLCVNARDAIAGVGKVTIETENTVFDEAYCAVHPGFACGEYVLLAVSDDGGGMNQEVLDHLFEPFFTTKEVGKGTGLGLATVYGIVKQNEGFINVYSEPDSGSTFKIYLPRFAGEASKPLAASAVEIPKGRGETVLLVEDEAAILLVGRTMLERLGYTVLTAGTPGEALRLAKAHAAEIQLLITDVVMPEMNGRDLAKLIRDIKPGLKCLFISGYTANVIAHRGVLDEGVFFLQKPFSMKDLASKVRQALERE
jgi:PAS domain S-box-containing protein